MVRLNKKVKSVDLSSDKLKNVECLQCLSCNKKYSLVKLQEDQGTTMINVCYEGCLGPLAVKFNTNNINLSKEEILGRPQLFSAIHELLPFEDKSNSNDFPFSELRYSNHFSEKTGLNVYFKLDMNLPSGSFKDRPVLASFKRAKETGYKKVFVASTGNLAISCLKLGKQFGFDVRVYLSNTLNSSRRKFIEQYIDDIDKQLVVVDGSYDDANVQAIQDCQSENKKDLEEQGQFTTFVPNNSFRPYYKEGSKTSGYEIATQLIKEGVAGDQNVHVFYPLGSGALICSAYKGIEELRELGVVENKFSFYGVQQEDLNPIVKAFKDKSRLLPQKATNHMVREIAIGNPGSGIETIDVLNKCNGDVEDVSEIETLETYLELYQNEKIFPQLCGALTLRGFEKIHSRRKFKQGDVVVINVTGNGLGKIEDDLLAYSTGYGFDKEIREILKEVGGKENG